MWVLKIDVQGGEVDVLRGAKRLLAERRVSWIYPEFDVMALHVLRSSAADLLNLLEAHDFSCVNSRQRNGHRALGYVGELRSSLFKGRQPMPRFAATTAHAATPTCCAAATAWQCRCQGGRRRFWRTFLHPAVFCSQMPRSSTTTFVRSWETRALRGQVHTNPLKVKSFTRHAAA